MTMMIFSRGHSNPRFRGLPWCRQDCQVAPDAFNNRQVGTCLSAAHTVADEFPSTIQHKEQSSSYRRELAGRLTSWRSSSYHYTLPSVLCFNPLSTPDLPVSLFLGEGCLMLAKRQDLEPHNPETFGKDISQKELLVYRSGRLTLPVSDRRLLIRLCRPRWE